MFLKLLNNKWSPKWTDILPQVLIQLNSCSSNFPTPHTNYQSPARTPLLVLTGDLNTFDIRENIIHIHSPNICSPHHFDFFPRTGHKIKGVLFNMTLTLESPRGQSPTKLFREHDYTDFMGPDNGPLSAVKLRPNVYG